MRYRAWYCVPSAREGGGTVPLWAERGYGTAVWRDPGSVIDTDICLCRPYAGYSVAVNELVRQVLILDPNVECLVTGGDDIEPDPHDPNVIADEFAEHFSGTYGVMQPTGDRWGDTPQTRDLYGVDRGACADRVAGSPWMGREFCQRINQGKGPMWPEYFHMFNDEEMQDVAVKLGIFWQRRDLIHYHRHFSREGLPEPQFLQRANSKQNWDDMRSLYYHRKSTGFPGHDPLPVWAKLTRTGWQHVALNPDVEEQ